MDPVEEELIDLALENPFNEFITFVTGPHAIAMGKEKTFAVKFADHRFSVQLHPNLRFQVIEGPHVVVATEKVNRNAGINNFCQFPKQTGVSFWNNGMVLEPEIEQVAHQEDFLGICFHHVKPFDKMQLAFQAAFPVRDAEMKIGSEVYFFIFLQCGLICRAKISKERYVVF